MGRPLKRPVWFEYEKLKYVYSSASATITGL